MSINDITPNTSIANQVNTSNLPKQPHSTTPDSNTVNSFENLFTDKTSHDNNLETNPVEPIDNFPRIFATILYDRVKERLNAE